jgi:hypothetical protein
MGAVLCGAGTLAAVSCSKDVHASAPTLHVVSSGIEDGETIPAVYTCDGLNVSPPLRWSKPPKSTQSIAVLCDDTDAPSGDFTHWFIYNLPPTQLQVPQHVPANPTLSGGAKQGQNDFDHVGYGGPCPPPGPPHHYHFHVYALDKQLTLADNAARSDFDSAIQGHIVAQGEIVALYGR